MCETIDTLEDEIARAAQNRLENPRVYLQREIEFFPLWDKENCKRNYDAIKEI